MFAQDPRNNSPVARTRWASWFRANGAAGGQLALVLLVAYVCFFHGVSAFGLVGPDEPRYASIARDMASTERHAAKRRFDAEVDETEASCGQFPTQR